MWGGSNHETAPIDGCLLTLRWHIERLGRRGDEITFDSQLLGTYRTVELPWDYQKLTTIDPGTVLYTATCSATARLEIGDSFSTPCTRSAIKSATKSVLSERTLFHSNKFFLI